MAGLLGREDWVVVERVLVVLLRMERQILGEGEEARKEGILRMVVMVVRVLLLLVMQELRH